MEIGVVLGGGGARGFAHVGALRALTEAGHEVVAVAGCSMGSMVGALFAAGHSPRDLAEMADGLGWRDLLERGRHGALFGWGRIEKLLRSHLPERFEDLSLPLEVTAVDCQKGGLLVLNRGELVPALLASSAIPGILDPVFHGGRVLLDGAMLNNIPVDVARTMTQAPIVAVEVAAPPNRELDFEGGDGLWNRIRSFLPGLDFQSGVGFYPSHRGLTIELFLKSYDIPQAQATRMRLAMSPPDLLVQPHLGDDFVLEDFHRWKEAEQAGYEATVAALEAGGW